MLHKSSEKQPLFTLHFVIFRLKKSKKFYILMKFIYNKEIVLQFILRRFF